MWSSIFSLDILYFWNIAYDSEDFWYRWTRDRIQDIGKLFSFFPSCLSWFVNLLLFIKINEFIPVKKGHFLYEVIVFSLDKFENACKVVSIILTSRMKYPVLFMPNPQ